MRRPARSQQLAVATLPRAPAAGCDNFAASKRRRIVQAKAAAIYSLALGALQLEQVESQKRLPRESCGCAGFSPKLHCARLGRSRALAVVARGAALLGKAGEGPTAVTTLSERSALVEAKAAAISTLGVGCLKAQLRRLEPKALLWGSRARWPRRLVDSPRAPS